MLDVIIFLTGFVIGNERDLSPARGLFGNVTRSTLLSPVGPMLDTRYNTRVNWAAAPRINLGYAMGRFLPYATIGYLYGETTSTGYATVRGRPCWAPNALQHASRPNLRRWCTIRTFRPLVAYGQVFVHQHKSKRYSRRGARSKGHSGWSKIPLLIFHSIIYRLTLCNSSKSLAHVARGSFLPQFLPKIIIFSHMRNFDTIFSVARRRLGTSLVKLDKLLSNVI